MNRFEVVKDIDEGAFGIVQMARNKETGEIVAIKKIKRKYNNWEECMNLREIKSLKKLKHVNIIKLKEVFKLEQELYLVFEYCRTNLFKFYNDEFKAKGRQMPEPLIKSIIYQIVSSLAYIHKLGFFHRDLKPENLLITERNVVKMADFGLAREIRSSPPYTDYVSTRWYRAPEILLKSTNYNSPVDIFALGCIMAELYLQAPLFNGASEMDQLSKIFAILGSPGKNWPEGIKLASQIGFNFPSTPAVNLTDIIRNASPLAIDLMKSMLNFDSSKRPTAAKILQHPYFTSNGGVPMEIENIDPMARYNHHANNPGSEIKDQKSNRFNDSDKPINLPSNTILQNVNSKEILIANFHPEQRNDSYGARTKVDPYYKKRSESTQPNRDLKATPQAQHKARGIGLEQICNSDFTGKKDALDLDIEELENEILSQRRKYESPNSPVKKHQKENNYSQSAFTNKPGLNESNNSKFHRADHQTNPNLFDDPLEELLNKEQMLIEKKDDLFYAGPSSRPMVNYYSGLQNNRANEFKSTTTEDHSKLWGLDTSKNTKYGMGASSKPLFDEEIALENNIYSHTASYLNGINILNKMPKATYQINN
jgi:serine/threonine protein kinase